MLIAVGLVLSLAVIFVIARLQAGEQRFPDGWLAYKWTVPQGATSAQIADAQLVLQEELAHLGATQVRTVVDGRDIHVGVPNDDGGSAIMTVGTRRLTPQVSLRVETGGEPTSMDPHNANLKRGDACYTPEAEFTACDFTRTFVASFAGEIVGGDLIADAQAVEPSGTPSPIPGSDGDWSVVVRFTPDGATQVGNAVSHTSKAQPVLVFIATIDSSDPFGLSRMVNGPGVAIDASNVAHLNGLSQVEAQRIAATLRLSRSTFAMAGGDFE